MPALCLLAAFLTADTAASAEDAPLQPPLAALVDDYLSARDTDRAGELLAALLRDPRATLSDVTAALEAGGSRGAAPVGLQPGVPVTVRGRTYHYGLYVPPSYQPSRDYALVLCLHGAGFTGDAYLERWQKRLGDGYILACPTLIQGTWWTRPAEELVLATLREVQARYRIDPDRIFLTGMSNGGIGAYLIGMHHAPLFAGLAPMASGLDGVLMPFLANLQNTPVYLIHGKQDEVMPVELSRTIAQELTRLGYAFHYQEHDRVHPMAGGHFFPREELPALVAWLDAQRRNPAPRRLTVLRDASHLLPFDWVRIDATDHIAAFSDLLTDSKDEALIARRYARLSAQIAGPNRIEVQSDKVRRYSLFLNGQMVDLAQPVTVVTNGRVSFQGMAVPSVEALLRDARQRRDPHRLFPATLQIALDNPS